MCRISTETAKKANEALKLRSLAGKLATASAPVGGIINVSTRICGKKYSRELTIQDIKNAYRVSLSSVKCALANGQSIPGATIKIER